ncbi:MAG: glycerate kinase, partial [Actinomycetota bacterium]|nr:glycerate kinase [Actinomycetota bacterium]
MRIVIAPDKFKGSLSAPDVAAHLEIGLRSVLCGLEVERIPVADGGEGTLDAAVGS